MLAPRGWPDTAAVGNATLKQLVHQLREGCDVLYLVCHGALCRTGPGSRDAVLYLEDDEGNIADVPGALLAESLKAVAEQPRLVVLASCQSAGGESLGDGGSLSAFGPLLAAAGIPAVVAMQGDVTMTTVKQFMPTFFEELQRDGVIDRAMAVARGKVRDRDDRWAPVLFMRLESGRLWYEQGPSDPTFPKWNALLRNIARGECTAVLGPGMVEPSLGAPLRGPAAGPTRTASRSCPTTSWTCPRWPSTSRRPRMTRFPATSS